MVLAATTLSLSSCSSEGDLTPSNADENLFSPTSADKSELAQLRNSFHEKVGSYLLFNDTLVTKQTGTDVYGNAVWHTETVDLNYFMTSDDGYIYEYNYITDLASQKKAAEFIENKLAPKLGSAVPYSFLLVNGITKYTYSGGVKTVVKRYNTPHPTLVLGMRCYAVSMEKGSTYDNSSFITKAFAQIVADKVSRLSESALAKFYSYSNKYYGAYKEDIGLKEGYDDDFARSIGFLEDYYSYDFPYSSTDLTKYETAICSYSLADFEEEYASYPICIAKFKFLRSLCESMGFKFDD
jgi:hypothetical protein